MDQLQCSEAIEQLLKLLEENGRQGQAANLSQLLWYMDSMSRQFDILHQELQEVKAQLAQEKQPAVQKIMEGVVTNLENKVEWARDILAGLRERIMDCAKNAVENFKEAGVSALDRAVSAMGVKKTLEALHEHISGMISGTKRHIEQIEQLGHELRSVGGHLKNAGRAVTGKEALEVNGGQEGRFQSTVLSPLRTAQNLLVKMNNTTRAAIGSVERLEQSAETARAALSEKKPSIRKVLAEKRAEIAAKAAPAPDKERKTPEAAR